MCVCVCSDILFFHRYARIEFCNLKVRTADTMADTEAVVEKNEELTKKYKRLETNQKDYAAEAQKEIKRQKCAKHLCASLC